MNMQTRQYLLKELGCAGLDIEIVRTTTSPYRSEVVQHYADSYGYNRQVILSQSLTSAEIVTFLSGMLACVEANIRIN